MQVLKMSAATGWRWVADGFRLLRKQPLGLLSMTLLFVLAVTVPTVVPVVGGFLPLLLMPLLSFGLMCAFRAVDRGEPPRPSMLWAGFREAHGAAWKPLLLLGVANALATLVALTVTTLLDGGTLMRIATLTIDPDDAGLRDSNLAAAAVVFLLAYTPTQMALWYAPQFVAWHRSAVLRSLFFSFVAVWRNKGAFLAFAIGWLAVAFAVSSCVQLLRAVLGANPTLASLVSPPVSLVMLTALYGSIWASYRDPIRDEDVAVAPQP